MAGVVLLLLHYSFRRQGGIGDLAKHLGGTGWSPAALRYTETLLISNRAERSSREEGIVQEPHPFRSIE